MFMLRRLLLILLALCLPLQSALSLAATPCPAASTIAAMPAMENQSHHDHAAMMLAVQHSDLHEHSVSHDGIHSGKHMPSGCGHCTHCPACSASAGINAIFIQPLLHPAIPETPSAAEALVSLVLDTPQRPPQTA